jgi:hypothetical protein
MMWNPQGTFNKVEDSIKKDLKDPLNPGKAGSTEVGKQVKTALEENVLKPTVAPIMETTIRPTQQGIDKLSEAWKKAEQMAKDWGGKAEDWWNKMQNSPSGGMNIPKVGGVGAGGIGGGAPSGPVQISAIQGGMGGGVGGDQNEFRQQQMTLAQQLAQQAAGQGPSLATEQLNQAQAANQAATFAQLASARGGANPGMARQAMQTSAQLQGQTARDAALARIQEQMGAREQLAGVANQGRTGDITTAGQQNELAIQQAGLSQAYEDSKIKWAQVTQNAEIANQMAALEMEKILQGQAGNNPLQQLLQGLSQTYLGVK